MRRLIEFALLALGLLAAASAQAQSPILKCVDAKGRVEYARMCPPGTTEEVLHRGKATGPAPAPGAAPATAAPPATPAPKTTAERDAAFRKRQLEQQEAEAKGTKQAQDEQLRQKNCDQSQGHLRALESGQRIRRADPKTGDLTYLQDDERPAEIAAARKSVESWCK